MIIRRPLFVIGFLVLSIDVIYANWRIQPKRVTAEYGSDLSLSCAFQDEDSDKTIVQWLYQNLTDSKGHQRTSRPHWRALFLNSQSLTQSETRYSIQQKTHQTNGTSIAYSTILTLTKVNESDEGLYMCKSLSPKTIQMTYQVRVIQSLDINPKEVLIPTEEVGQYSLRLSCILTDKRTGRPHEIHWWHNNKRLGAQSNRYPRIVKNNTQHTFISTLLYTGEAANIVGNYTCETDPLRRYIVVNLEASRSSTMRRSLGLDLGIHVYFISTIGIFFKRLL